MSMGILTSLFCLWATMPGPPGITWNQAWFQALPITPCNGIVDPSRDVTFELYQGTDAITHRQLRVGDDSLIKLSGFDPNLPTVVYIHGFLNHLEAEEVKIVKQAYMLRGGHNFIAVGWRRLAAGPWYEFAVKNVLPVGKHVASLLDSLESVSGPLKSLHVIGHSLGAHVAGVIGNNTKIAKVERITGLDPALPFIDLNDMETRLDTGDAPFVDVIHTDGDNFGLSVPIGHVDFYPNGGRRTHPGCGIFDTPASLNFLDRVFCSHHRSYFLYAATVIRENIYMSTPCDSWENFQAGTCETDDKQIPLGYATPKSARGSYYLKVQEVPPYHEQRDLYT